MLFRRVKTIIYICHYVRAFFFQIVQSCVVKIRKPDPRIFELTLNLLQLDAADVVFLDDIRVNVEAARQLGIRSIEVI